MNRDKIRENINTLFSWARDTTDGTGIEQEVHKAYQSAITELQSDVAVMRKITPETKFEDGEKYFSHRKNAMSAITTDIFIYFDDSEESFFQKKDSYPKYSEKSIREQFTHYLQIELE